MANRDAPNGFAPVAMLDGSEVPVRRFPLLSTHRRAGIGDLAIIVSSGNLDIMTDPTSAPEGILGAVVAIYDSSGVHVGSPNSSVGTKYITASAGGYVDIALAVPNAVFRCQTSGSASETDRFASADTDSITQCDTTTGLSLMELSGTQSTGAANWLVLDKVDEPGNAWGTNVQLLVLPCESYFVGTTAQVRVGI